ncbi:MAG: ATP-binding protein [Myxococcales bacterium]|nr:ATP-binding protein [Myxococcales bacterium]
MPHDERTRDERLAQYRTLLETSIDGFFINRGGRFDYVNPAFVRMVGAHSADQILGREVFDFIDADSHAAVRERISQLGQSNRPVAPLEERYVRLDGTRIDVEISAVAVEAEGEHAMLVTVRDISGRRRTERERQQLEERLQHAQKLEALGTLASGIAHDFNNILAALGGHAELAQRVTDGDHPAARNLREILVAVERGRGLTQQVLTFGRQRPTQRRTIELRAAVAASISLLRAATPPGVHLQVDLGQSACAVVADPTQVHQVLLNLCTNAFQSFEDRSGHVSIGLRIGTRRGESYAPADLPDGRYAVLTVLDDGPGIDPEVAERIFDPFFTTKGEHSGTGLGLSVVDGIARNHGGAICCESQLGRGSTFRFYLPLAHAPELLPSDRPPASEPGVGERIYYLDDEKALVSVVCEQLNNRGYRCQGGATPHELLAMLRKDPQSLDLLITDQRMPEQSGIDVARKVRELSPELPILLITGYLDSRVETQARELGIEEIVDKPASGATLSAAVARALASGRTR